MSSAKSLLCVASGTKRVLVIGKSTASKARLVFAEELGPRGMSLDSALQLGKLS